MNEFEFDAISTLKTRTLATLADLARNPKPTYKIDDATVSWNEYQDRLLKTVDWCDRKLRDGEPFESRSRGAVD